MKKHCSWGNQEFTAGLQQAGSYLNGLWFVLLLLASLPRTGSFPLSFSSDEGLQPSSPRPPLLKLCLQIAKCLNTDFPINSNTSSLNLQFSLQGLAHQRKLCPRFVDSFKKPVLLLTQLYRLWLSHRTPAHNSVPHFPPS